MISTVKTTHLNVMIIIVYYMIMFTTCQRNLTALELACVIVTCHVCLSTKRVPLISQESSSEISSDDQKAQYIYTAKSPKGWWLIELRHESKFKFLNIFDLLTLSSSLVSHPINSRNVSLLSKSTQKNIHRRLFSMWIPWYERHNRRYVVSGISL